MTNVESLGGSAIEPHLPSLIAVFQDESAVADYQRELAKLRTVEIRLRHALAEQEALLHKKDELIQQQQLAGREADHRLLNELQIIVSILSMQSRASNDVAVASQLATAADRVATAARIHRRLHAFDGTAAIQFKKFLDELVRDFSTMIACDEIPKQLVVESIEAELPTAIAIPLTFIVIELITNATKHGTGPVTVRFEQAGENRYVLSVSNDGPALPEGFDPTASSGLGMRIVLGFVKQIRGELRIGSVGGTHETRFAIPFSA